MAEIIKEEKLSKGDIAFIASLPKRNLGAERMNHVIHLYVNGDEMIPVSETKLADHSESFLGILYTESAATKLTDVQPPTAPIIRKYSLKVSKVLMTKILRFIYSDGQEYDYCKRFKHEADMLNLLKIWGFHELYEILVKMISQRDDLHNDAGFSYLLKLSQSHNSKQLESKCLDLLKDKKFANGAEMLVLFKDYLGDAVEKYPLFFNAISKLCGGYKCDGALPHCAGAIIVTTPPYIYFAQ